MRHLQAAAAVNCIGHHDIGQLAAPPQGKQPGHFAKLAGGKVGEVNKNQPGIIQMANGGRKEVSFSNHRPIIPMRHSFRKIKREGKMPAKIYRVTLTMDNLNTHKMASLVGAL